MRTAGGTGCGGEILCLAKIDGPAGSADFDFDSIGWRWKNSSLEMMAIGRKLRRSRYLNYFYYIYFETRY